MTSYFFFPGRIVGPALVLLSPPQSTPLPATCAVRLPSVQKLPLWGQNTECAHTPLGDDVVFVTHCNSVLVNMTDPSSATF